MILDNNFLVVRSSQMTLSNKRAGDFYEEHKGKFFYNRLVTYMSSGPMQALILAKEGAIADWRTLMGTKAVRRFGWKISPFIQLFRADQSV